MLAWHGKPELKAQTLALQVLQGLVFCRVTDLLGAGFGHVLSLRSCPAGKQF